MAQVTFIGPDGSETVVENAIGTLMEIARENGVEGIDGSCGGVCSCSTCHVKVNPGWLEKVGPPGYDERDLLELDDATDARSRLGCQIEMSDKLDGLIVEVHPL